MSDYMIWPFMERYPAKVNMTPAIKLHEDKFPKLLAWTKRMLDDPAVRALINPNRIYQEFYEAKFEGHVPYDQLCKKLNELV